MLAEKQKLVFCLEVLTLAGVVQQSHEDRTKKVSVDSSRLGMNSR